MWNPKLDMHGASLDFRDSVNQKKGKNHSASYDMIGSWSAIDNEKLSLQAITTIKNKASVASIFSCDQAAPRTLLSVRL